MARGPLWDASRRHVGLPRLVQIREPGRRTALSAPTLMARISAAIASNDSKKGIFGMLERTAFQRAAYLPKTTFSRPSRLLYGRPRVRTPLWRSCEHSYATSQPNKRCPNTPERHAPKIWGPCDLVWGMYGGMRAKTALNPFSWVPEFGFWTPNTRHPLQTPPNP